MRYQRRTFALFLLLSIASPVLIAAEVTGLPAFPGAQGCGTTTPGGRGGTVYVVTRLDDYGEDEEPIPGTLRHAIEQEGPRCVVFAVGGMLKLKRRLFIRQPYLTIAGNTAPFPGVTVTNYDTKVRANHVVLRYLRFRMNIELMRERFAQKKDSGWDCVGGRDCEYVVFDHVSGSHSVDETISFSPNVDRVTLQHSISAYSLRSVFHDYYFKKGPKYQHTLTHNLGGLLAYLGKHDRHAAACAHHNIYAHHDRRMPGLSAGRDDPQNMISYIDLRNNLMYNWKSNAAGIETGSLGRSKYHVNFIGNYVKPGKNTPRRARFAAIKVMGHNRIYLQGNVHDEYARKEQITPQKKLVLDQGKAPKGLDRYLDKPLPTPPVSTDPTPTLEALANRTVGASIPCRDSIDARTIRDIHEGTGEHPFVDMETNSAPPLPSLPTVQRPVDDDDPFPRWWKRMQGLPADARIDPLADPAGDGYTNIEAYMFGLRLDRKPVDWQKLKHNRNPLDRSDHVLSHLFTGSISTEGWANRKEGETIFSSVDGLVLLAGSTDSDHGCRHVLTKDNAYWSAGSTGKEAKGPEGATSEDGAALVLAFPLPQTLAGIRIAKPDPNAYGSAHDPETVRIEALLGWPGHWTDLTGEVRVPAFGREAQSFAVLIPEEKGDAYAAYRLVFPRRNEANDLRLQYLELMPRK